MTDVPTREGPGARWREDVLAVMTGMLDECRGVTQRTMFGVPAFFVDGRLFCCVWGDGVGLRLPMAQAQTVTGADGLGPFRPFGRAPMRGWVQRDRALAAALREDEALIMAACEHVRSL